MFKYIIHITYLCLIISLFSCAGESQYNDTALASVEESKSIPGNSVEFTEELNINKLPESLSKEQQEAFELRAQQKFQDFLDYLKIVSDPKIDKGLVEHSENLMKELFINDSVTFYDGDTILYQMIDHNDPILLFDYIRDSKLVSHREKIESKINSFNVVSPLKLDSISSNYVGKLEIDMVLNQKATLKTIDVYLVESTKQFAEEEQKTIEIKLGNIY